MGNFLSKLLAIILASIVVLVFSPIVSPVASAEVFDPGQGRVRVTAMCQWPDEEFGDLRVRNEYAVPVEAGYRLDGVWTSVGVLAGGNTFVIVKVPYGVYFGGYNHPQNGWVQTHGTATISSGHPNECVAPEPPIEEPPIEQPFYEFVVADSITVWNVNSPVTWEIFDGYNWHPILNQQGQLIVTPIEYRDRWNSSTLSFEFDVPFSRLTLGMPANVDPRDYRVLDAATGDLLVVIWVDYRGEHCQVEDVGPGGTCVDVDNRAQDQNSD